MKHKERFALSIFEIMHGPISPDLKTCMAKNHSHVFKSGLMGQFYAGFMFSNLDIFIEKPSSILFLQGLKLHKRQRGKKTEGRAAGQATHRRQNQVDAGKFSRVSTKHLPKSQKSAQNGGKTLGHDNDPLSAYW